MIVHIAGPVATIGNQQRQRCLWCGALLSDYDLTRVQVAGPEWHPPAAWPPGALVVVDGNAQWTIDDEEGAELPPAACARLDPTVTA